MTAPGPNDATEGAARRRIDIHHHLSPPTHLETLKKAKLGSPPTFAWTPQQSLDEMEQAGVATAFLAVTTPVAAFLDRDMARRVARECNEYGAQLRADFPGRFGMFAALPLPYIEDAVREIEYAFDALGADGICLMTSYGDKWLGHADFDPVLEALHRRRAVVHVHPTVSDRCTDILPNIPPPLIEYGTDSTRAIANLIFTGASARYQDISFIFSHGGGTMPFLIERFNNLPTSDKRYAAFTSAGVVAELQRFYYDTAIITHPAPLAALSTLIPLSQILFGSDFPLRSATNTVKGLRAFFNEEQMLAIDRGNALRLLPQLGTL